MKKLYLLSTLCLIASWVSAREYIDINADWKFHNGSVSNGYEVSIDDNGWSTIALPHSWNAIDGQDGGGNYRRGDGWYRKKTAIPASTEGKRVYLDIGAACMQTWVYVNGNYVGKHVGGYARFTFDITEHITPGEQALIAIRVNNEDVVAPPRSADFTFSGGIQRAVRLLITEPLHLTPTNHFNKNGFLTLNEGADIASPGVRIRQTKVSDASAQIDVTARTRNASYQSADATVRVTIYDRAGNKVVESEKVATIAAGKNSNVTQTLTVENPHLWDGLNDPYLYRTEVVVLNGTTETDRVVQPLGIRYYSVDKEKGFFLNDKSYPLRGMANHEELIDKGRALSDADRLRDLEIARRSGLNYLRLSHYQHGDYTYDYCDSVGIIVWTEIPAINYMSDASALTTYQHHAASQLYELIRQQYNHPCVMFWGLCNEIRQSKTNVDIYPVLKALNDLAHNEDPTRLTTLAHDKAGNEQITSTYKEWSLPDVIAVNKYVGWYEGSKNNMDGDFESRMTQVNTLCSLPVGMSEYGAGGSPFQHQYPNPETGGNGSNNHPEEFQNKSHEKHLSVINRTEWFWGTSLWAVFDFASDGRKEGDEAGINDKGVVTHDRAVKKDAYHLYRANWARDEGVIYICSRRYAKRGSSVPVAVYSNCSSVILKVNGRTVGTMNCDNNIHLYTLNNVSLQSGANVIEAVGLYKGEEISDKAVWYNGTATNTVNMEAGNNSLVYVTPEAGTYTTRIFYRASASSPVQFTTGDFTTTYTFGESGSETRFISVNLYLKKGANTITLTALEDGIALPEIGKMEFYYYHAGVPHFEDNVLTTLVPIPDNPNRVEDEGNAIIPTYASPTATAGRYDLSGRPIQEPKGIFIENGKKQLKK